MFLPKVYNKIIIVCVLLCAFFVCFSSTASKAHADTGTDSLMDYENKTTMNWGSALGVVKSIIKIIKLAIGCLKELIVFRADEVSNTCIPYEIGPTVPTVCPNTKNFHFSTAALIAMIASLVAAAVSIALVISFPGIGFAVAVGILVFYYPILTACLATYTLSAAEFLMAGGSDSTQSGAQLNNIACNNNNGTVTIDPQNQKPYLTVQDVPFVYNCIPPDTSDPGGITYKGYVGIDSEFCAIALNAKNAMPNKTHKTFVMRVDLWKRILGNRDHCEVSADQFIIGDPQGDPDNTGTPTVPQDISFPGPFGVMVKMKLYTYYTLSGNKVKLCSAVGHPFLLPNPVIIGCEYIPPPVEDVSVDSGLIAAIKGTRCQYIMPGSHRTDLSNVAYQIFNEQTSQDTNSVYLFLKSDWHVLSTVVGCFQDILETVFIDDAYDESSESFLQVIQTGLQSIVFASIILYVSLLGIRLISGSQPPSRGEWIMFAVKFALVLGVATGNLWLGGSPTIPGGSSSSGPGFYHAIIDTMQVVGSIFMDAREDNEPINMCYYPYDGGNLLSQRVVSLYGTSAHQYDVQMSVWDYVDCVLVTYLNFNSCNFTTSGIILFWFVSTGFWLGCTGLLMSIFCLIYLIMLLEVVFEFAHIMILSMFVVTVLVLMSPLIMCFYLFEVTKDITESWFLTLLGYMIYPGALFAFLALMLSTFDSVFYGTLVTSEAKKMYECSLTNSCAPIDEAELIAICGADYKNVSPYCAMLSAAIGHTSITNCGYSNGTFTDFFTERKNIPLLGQMTMMKRNTLSLFFEHIKTLMLFALLFHFMMGSMVEFVAQLFGVSSLSQYAAGGQIGRKLGSMAVGGLKQGLTYSLPALGIKGGAKLGQKIVDRIKGGGGGGGKNDEESRGGGPSS